MERKNFLISVGLAGAVAMLLFLAGVLQNGTVDYWYLIYNLFLAAIPLLFARVVLRLLKKYAWKNWRVVVATALWLLFLPNSFYIVTDFIHVADTPRIDMVQDVAMLMQFSMLGLAFGYGSLLLLHRTYAKYLGARTTMALAVFVLFLSSIAIYLGRELRWNSWDVVLNPAALFVDSLYVWASPGAVMVVLSYFAMLGSFYLVGWYGIAYLKNKD